MATVTIDNKVFEYEGQHKLLQFCLDRGVDVPHFCYHPEMSIPANCRQCLVKVGSPAIDRETKQVQLDDDGNAVIRYLPKLQTGCSIDITDGMVVHTQRSDETVAGAQKDTLEFLLINHPLDCPICDQAGHCPLQNQAYKYGPEGSRFEFNKVHKPKHIPLGPRVTLDAERCINCTRCVRFTEEISGSNQLTIVERGVRNYPITPPGIEFDEPYSMNVIDICPVGALTSTDFRFEARVWEMSNTPSITTTNGKGSNCYYWVKDNQIKKITARGNDSVNKYWLADEDRLDYKRFNENRPSDPLVNGEVASWEDAIESAGKLLGQYTGDEVLFIGSPNASVEDNHLLVRLAEHLGSALPTMISHYSPGAGDGWLVTDDKAANTNGCRRLGIGEIDASMAATRLRSGAIKLVYVLEDDPVAMGTFSKEDLASCNVILHYYNTTNETLPLATVALPAATIVETVGTFVNVDGHAQRARPAKAIRGVNRNLAMEMGKSRLDEHATPFDRWSSADQMVNCKPSWEIIPSVADALGLELNFKGPRQILEEVSETYPGFAGVSYKAMGLEGMRLAEIGQPA